MNAIDGSPLGPGSDAVIAYVKYIGRCSGRPNLAMLYPFPADPLWQVSVFVPAAGLLFSALGDGYGAASPVSCDGVVLVPLGHSGGDRDRAGGGQ